LSDISQTQPRAARQLLRGGWWVRTDWGDL